MEGRSQEGGARMVGEGQSLAGGGNLSRRGGVRGEGGARRGGRKWGRGPRRGRRLAGGGNLPEGGGVREGGGDEERRGGRRGGPERAGAGRAGADPSALRAASLGSQSPPRTPAQGQEGSDREPGLAVLTREGLSLSCQLPLNVPNPLQLEAPSRAAGALVAVWGL